MIYFYNKTKVKNAKPFYKGHHQPRKPGDEKGYLGYYYLWLLGYYY